MCRDGEDPKIARQQKVYSSSQAEPIAICRKRPSSASPLRPQPSAMLAPIDAAARRIWAANPYSSSLGKFLVWTYTFSGK